MKCIPVGQVPDRRLIRFRIFTFAYLLENDARNMSPTRHGVPRSTNHTITVSGNNRDHPNRERNGRGATHRVGTALPAILPGVATALRHAVAASKDPHR